MYVKTKMINGDREALLLLPFKVQRGTEVGFYFDQ